MRLLPSDFPFIRQHCRKENIERLNRQKSRMNQRMNYLLPKLDYVMETSTLFCYVLNTLCIYINQPPMATFCFSVPMGGIFHAFPCRQYILFGDYDSAVFTFASSHSFLLVCPLPFIRLQHCRVQKWIFFLLLPLLNTKKKKKKQCSIQGNIQLSTLL